MALVIRLGAVLVMLFVTVCMWTGVAQANEPIQLAEQKIKAGLLYNFLKYTQWPAPIPPGVVVCLLGGDPFDGALTPMAGRTVNERAIAVRAIGDVGQADDCAMLIVHANGKDSWPAWRAMLSKRPVLTVSDFDGFATQGGMIEFARAENRICVKINLGAVNAVRLRVEERLLKLATVVPSNAMTEP
jgi:hypothetical protein